ncbi:MAG: phosphatase PAP2 family protein [Paludibacteraceae bacterium]|nr:phosphatase PAP2 family protein [Paludibacteraceae bacterium]
MRAFLRNNSLFLLLSLLLIVALALAIALIPKGELHLMLCNRHTPARDLLYRYYTRVAEWLPYVICLSILLFGKAGNAALATSCVAFSELTTQILKRIVCAPRPLTWFANNMPDVQLPLVEGVRMNHWLSFPSGHTTSFFALFFALSIVSTKSLTAKRAESTNTQQRYILLAVAMFLQISLVLLAALGGYSRIYLSQHFASDVLGGMTVGILISTLCYTIFCRYEGQKWYNYRFLKKK